jgi:hypothetical protein
MMTNKRDKLLKLSRRELEAEARSLGLSVSDSLSRAELITLIEQQYALQEFGELRTFSEHRFLIAGLFFVTMATFILAWLSLIQIQTPTIIPFVSIILVPMYIIVRCFGGFLIAAALFSLALKGYRNLSPVTRAACILGAILVTIIVIVLVPMPNQWGIP